MKPAMRVLFVLLVSTVLVLAVGLVHKDLVVTEQGSNFYLENLNKTSGFKFMVVYKVLSSGTIEKKSGYLGPLDKIYVCTKSQATRPSIILADIQ